MPAVEVSGAGREQIPLLEREAEREALRSLIGGAAAGEGGTAVICGPAGIGKTRLLAESGSLGAELGLACHRAVGSELERGFAFGAVQQLFEHELMALSKAARAEVFSGAAAQAEVVFPALVSREQQPTEATHAVLHGLYWLLVNLSARQPRMLLIDDAHWLDDPSLRWLAYLSRRATELAVCLIVGTRPPDPKTEHEALQELTTRGRLDVLTPSPLTLGAVTGFLSSQLGCEPDPKFVEACHQTTGGNPFYLSELSAELARRALAPTSANTPEVARLMPDSVVQSVGVRLRRLPRPAVALARVVAILADIDQSEHAGQLAGLSGSEVAEAADTLTRAGIFDPGGLVFVHPLLRSAVYAEIPVAERDELHFRAAQVLIRAGARPERAAAHLLASQPRQSDWSLEVLLNAARSARLRGAPEAAANYLRRALAQDPPRAKRAEVLRELGHSLVAAEGLDGISHLREARELAPDATSQSEISLEVAQALFAQGLVPEAAEVLAEVVAQGQQHGLASESVLRAHLACMTLLDLRALERVGGLAGVAELVRGSRQAEGLAMATLSWVEVATRPPAAQGAALAQKALEDQSLMSGQDLLGLAAAMVAFLAADELSRARPIWDGVISAARSRGALATLRFALAHRGMVNARLGDLKAVEEDTRELIEWALELPTPISEYSAGLPWVIYPLVEALMERGELKEADDWAQLSTPTPDSPPVLSYSFLLETVGRLRLAQGRHQEAVTLLRECGRRMEAWGILNPGFVPWQSSLALALAATNMRAEARELCAQEIDLARRFEAPRALGVALTRAAAVGEGDERLAWLSEATGVLDRTPAKLAQARAWGQYGATLLARGKRWAAREALRHGLDLAIQCGATELARRVQTDLVATGARPRRTAITGAGALTPAEARVARLASSGLTNREIAEALFITEKTVEGHLANVFRKLNISSRAQLPEVRESADERST